jgi:[pyruvate, water dikinase]-phosphate phosphotransferase / [pyruvate, water dikinase] kinase
MLKRTIFYVSDGTGITAETIGNSLLTQFEGIDFRHLRIPFVDSEDKALVAVDRIRGIADAEGVRPIVINTVVDAHLCEILARSGGLMVDVFAAFLSPLEAEFGVKRAKRINKAHQVDSKGYENRIDATNFALSHDDGVDVDYKDADLILVGVSRSGKTPTCLYMALQFGVKAANYPLTPEDLDSPDLPKRLKPHQNKIFGLTIDPVRLQQIRGERRPNSRYSSMEQCRFEVAKAEAMFRNHRLPSLNTTHTSIEEIASKVMLALGLDKHLY